tara:strand:+ start:873 stop:1031 length:159 start_codon:yes stop_codon:yes gene_type:complete
MAMEAEAAMGRASMGLEAAAAMDPALPGTASMVEAAWGWVAVDFEGVVMEVA